MSEAWQFPGPGQCAISDWFAIDQQAIDEFTRVTQDNQWIHNDRERAKAELPGGTTIAPGYLLLSLLPKLGRESFGWIGERRRINYGSNKVRFLAPVPPGTRVRLRRTVKTVHDAHGGQLMTFDNVLEIDGSDTPAMVAETLTLVLV